METIRDRNPFKGAPLSLKLAVAGVLTTAVAGNHLKLPRPAVWAARGVIGAACTGAAAVAGIAIANERGVDPVYAPSVTQIWSKGEGGEWVLCEA